MEILARGKREQGKEKSSRRRKEVEEEEKEEEKKKQKKSNRELFSRKYLKIKYSLDILLFVLIGDNNL